jgi:hypothetical protein
MKTNTVPRNLIYGYELTEKEKEEFDYLSAEEIDSHEFFRYKDNVYDPSEFMRTPENSELGKWDGYYGNSYFSGILIKYVNDCEQVIVARYYS